jgi:hypothetical protein
MDSLSPRPSGSPRPSAGAENASPNLNRPAVSTKALIPLEMKQLVTSPNVRGSLSEENTVPPDTCIDLEPVNAAEMNPKQEDIKNIEIKVIDLESGLDCNEDQKFTKDDDQEVHGEDGKFVCIATHTSR